jgi:hypothetical protein
MMRLASLMFAAACVHTAVHAADDPMQAVEVQGVRNPEMRTYRSVMAGLDAFDEYRKLAPNAPPLSFRYRSNKNGVPPEAGLQLRITGKGDSTYINVAPDGEFIVPRIASAYDDDGDLILNRKAHTYRSDPVVRTPGLAPDVLRMGDLRLSCQVIVGIGKYELGFLLRTTVTGLLRTSDWCAFDGFGKGEVMWSFPVPARLRGAYVEEGNRSAKIEVTDMWRVPAPIGNAVWSDDALIHLEFAPPAPTADKPAQFDAQPIYVRGLMDKSPTAYPLARQADGSYRAEIKLAKGKQRFRLGSDDLLAVDFGARPGQSDMKADEANAMVWGGGTLAIAVKEPGIYAFVLNVADPVAPQMMVTRLP